MGRRPCLVDSELELKLTRRRPGLAKRASSMEESVGPGQLPAHATASSTTPRKPRNGRRLKAPAVNETGSPCSRGRRLMFDFATLAT